MDKRKQFYSELQNSKRTYGLKLKCCHDDGKKKALDSSAASVAITTASSYVLSKRFIQRMGGEKKCQISCYKQRHFDVALKGKQIRRLQVASRCDYFCSSQFINIHVWFLVLQS